MNHPDHPTTLVPVRVMRRTIRYSYDIRLKSTRKGGLKQLLAPPPTLCPSAVHAPRVCHSERSWPWLTHVPWVPGERAFGWSSRSGMFWTWAA